MKAVFLTTSLSRNLGGIFEIERALALELHRLGVGIEAAGLSDEHWEADRPSWLPLQPEAFGSRGPRGFGYSPELAARVLASDADLLHLHALWMHPSVIAGQWGCRLKRPYLVTPNGMLEPWALANSRWKKKIALALYERRMLDAATCLQANTRKELEDFRALGLRNPVAILPNGVFLPPEMPEPGTRERKRLLFLGRLHPKKGLVHALKAWAAAKDGGRGDWQFVIAGWDQGGHRAELAALCDELGLPRADVPAAELLRNPLPAGVPEDAVIFAGPAFGADKDALFHQAGAFILPSFSEGLPMSVLEAWSHRLPVVMTDACNLDAGFVAGAAIRVGTDAESTKAGLLRLFELAAGDLAAMGANGRALVERHFTWHGIAKELETVYGWMLGGGARPGCVS